MSADLHERLLAAHRDGTAHTLSSLYAQAADLRRRQGDADAACFYLTHSYVFGLDAGLDMTVTHARLKARGREE